MQTSGIQIMLMMMPMDEFIRFINIKFNSHVILMSAVTEIFLASKVSIKVIISTLTRIYNIADSIANTKYVGVQERVYRLDIIEELKEIHSFLKDLNNIHIKYVNIESVATAIISLEKAISDICSTFEKLGAALKGHPEKWLNEYRSVDYEKEYAELENYGIILSRRYQRVQRLLKMPWAMLTKIANENCTAGQKDRPERCATPDEQEMKQLLTSGLFSHTQIIPTKYDLNLESKNDILD